MNARRFTSFALLVLTGAAISACYHTPPGTPVEMAYVRRAEVVRLPPTPVPLVVAQPAIARTEPREEKTELVADAYSRGEFCAKAGKDDEAIAAFKEAVRLDPTFGDAWTYLAALYEKTGKDKEALNAFKHAKSAATPAPTPTKEG